MEFTDYADSPTRSGDLLSLQRQRILAAQIKDSELGEDDVLLPTADTFDSAVESVSLYILLQYTSTHIDLLCFLFAARDMSQRVYVRTSLP